MTDTDDHRVHFALLAQNYARVATEQLSPAGDINLADPAVPAQLNQALQQTTTSSDWMALGHQFALLRQMAGGQFTDLYLRASGNVLNLAVVARVGGSPVTPDSLRPPFEYVWPIIENTDDHLQAFQLPPAVQQAAKQLVQGYLSSTQPAVAAAASLLNAAVSSAFADSGPQASFIAVCAAGISDELVEQLENWKFLHKKVEVSLRPPYLAAFAWDVTSNQIKGKDVFGGGMLSPTQLRQSLQGQ